MRIAAAQLNPTVGDLRGNVEKIVTVIETVRNKGVDLVVFPEMALTGYPPRDLLLYSAFMDEVERIVQTEILPLSMDLSVLLGCPWRYKNKDGFLYNTALFISKGAIISCHEKSLLPNYDVFDERRYFTPAKVRRPAEINGEKVAVTICEDVWNDKDYWQRPLYTEDPLVELFQQGARLLINISASPYHLDKTIQREEMLCALAQKYAAPLIYLNQVGGNDELIFDGSSLLCSADGRVLYRAESFREEIIYCHYSEGEGLLTTNNQHFKIDAAPVLPPGDQLESDEGVEQVFHALCLGLKDYLKKSGLCSVVMGLSGGIDSAVTAALAVETLGPEHVLGVIMPSRYSSGHSFNDALLLAQNLKLGTRTISIEEIFTAYLSQISNDNKICMDLAEENIQARIRGSILMFISNREKSMVLTTGNKSELAVGYCTLYGDMCGGLAVLADVPKTMVYELARFMNKRAGQEIIPNTVIHKEPSAELRPDQKDQDSLPPYALLDQILHFYIEENCHIDEITALGYDRELVADIVEKVDRAEFKRYQAAPGLRVTTRAFGSGRRMPLARGSFYRGTEGRNVLTRSRDVG